MSSEKKNIKKWLIIIPCLIVIIAFVSAIFAYSYYNSTIYKPMADKGQATNVEVVIDKGSSSEKISSILYDEGLIKNPLTFKLYLKTSKLGSKIKAGKYEFNTGMNVEEIVNKMVKGEVKKESVKVTIPEGYEIKDIAAAFEKAGLVKKDKFIETAQNVSFDYDFLKGLPERPMKLEGYLFPDTYEFAKDVAPEQIIRKMLDRFNEVFNEDMRKKAVDMNLSIDQVVTMASIVEREAKVSSERPIVAAVFYNRIKSKMRLESCATIQYALGERKERLLNKDLEIKSPYNTYKNDGLPIGPIANPGKASLEAALNPANVDYLYFVVKDQNAGTHAFSKSYQDFLKDKDKYIKSLK